MRYSCSLVLSIALGSAQGSAVAATETADRVFQGGKVVTVDPALGTVEAVAIRGGRILAVGTDDAIAAFVGDDTEVVDLEGKLVIPGFIEGHGHFMGLGEAMMNLDLTRARSWQGVVELVAEAARQTPDGAWIVGRGWHQEKWTERPRNHVDGFPVHDELSAVSPNNPVLLTHASGHACCANEMAMNVAGISGATPNPPGGEILRDDRGQPIGVFNETAQSLLWQFVETADVSARRERAIELATRECLAKGVTSFQDAGSSFATIDALREHADRGDLGIRLWVMVRESNDALREHLSRYTNMQRLGEGRLTVGGLKRSIDGALGSRGAWLLEPYSDQPDTSGLETATVDDVTETARIALAHRLQLCVHAIGDRANREVLDICEKIIPAGAGGNSLRWRIEHAQHIHPDDIPRFGRLGVIASMQGVHCTSDGPWVVARLGETRAREGAYVWRSLRETGALVINGTDAPVEDVDPLASFYASVTRRLSDGRVFYGEQTMTREEALRSYTIDAAYAAFEEDVKGSLTPGKYADLVVLSRDILEVPAESIPGTRVLLTVLDGEVVYDAR